jgi:hypothetical protein
MFVFVLDTLFFIDKTGKFFALCRRRKGVQLAREIITNKKSTEIRFSFFPKKKMKFLGQPTKSGAL